MKRLFFFVIVILIFVLIGCQSAGTETAVEPTITQQAAAEETVPTPIPATVTVPPPTEEPQTAQFPDLEEALQTLVEAQVEANFPGAILMVDAPDIEFSWQGAAGMADVEGEVPLETDTPFRISGITNTMMGALMLRLAEEGKIGLDDPISQYLDPAVTDQLNGPDGEPYGEMITVRQLLNGTSGIAGYFFEGEEDIDRNNSPDLIDIIINDPDKVWQPEDVIAYTTSNLDANFAPGEAYGANDLGYVLLGLVAEAAAGTSVGEAYQTWLFEPLGMSDTFLAQPGDPRMEKVAHAHFIKSVDVSDNESMSWFSHDIVSTGADLTRFMRAWANDEIFSDPASKEAMTEWISMASGGYEGLFYGLGLLYFDYEQTEMPEIGELLFHPSVWNGFVSYLPHHNVVIVGTLNQAMPQSSYSDLLFPAITTLLPYVTEE